MSSILVHQALHGYNDGHRLISSSLPLDAIDARFMLVMSDLSGPGVKPSPNGYLTGYPLEKSGRYVLARTWAAPEMPRPGCVWTHSLIIENADLAKITSAQTLLGAFTRPAGMNIGLAYGAPVSVSAHPYPNGIERTERVELLLEALYSSPTKQVVTEAGEPFDDEKVVTAIWMQQWPRLRRSFGFCTLSGMDRSGKGIALDLQFAREKDRQLRSKFPDAILADRGGISDTLQPLLTDLAEPASSTLREFLKRIGGDVDGGRRAMRPLCELYSSLLGSHPPDLTSAVSALAALNGDGRRQARSVRTLVARQALKAAGQIEDEVFEFLLETLERSSDPAEQAEIGDRVGIELWRRSPRRFYSALVSEGPLGGVTSHALAEMQSDQIVAGLQTNGQIASAIAERRPDVLMHPAFWRIPEVDDGLAERISNQDVGRAARALLAAGRIGPATAIISRTDPVDLISALESAEADPSTMLQWLAVLCRDRNKTAAVLATGRVTRMATILAVARQSRPDDVPNACGEDPWLIALRTATGVLVRSDEDFLSAFLLARALGWESRSQAELLRYSFTRVYRAFEEGGFSDEAKSIASWRLDWNAWFSSDMCVRLTETVTRRFVEQDLAPQSFGRLTDDGPLAISLIDEAARTGRGRKYLERVRMALKDATEAGIRARADYIAKKLK
ncbi:hypothetical protein [Massilia sp. METH4]|uniref:GAP1-N1 domain-containing protein n=1 Tax=Massilia sp. METH4 TaxID=3123041 RepID=UPI0030D00AB8